jgi:hypothetical protein
MHCCIGIFDNSVPNFLNSKQGYLSEMNVIFLYYFIYDALLYKFLDISVPDFRNKNNFHKAVSPRGFFFTLV